MSAAKAVAILGSIAAVVAGIATILSSGGNIFSFVFGDGPRANPLSETSVVNVEIYSGEWKDISGLEYSILETRYGENYGGKLGIRHRGKIVFADWLKPYESRSISVGNCSDLQVEIDKIYPAIHVVEEGKPLPPGVSYTTLHVSTRCEF